MEKERRVSRQVRRQMHDSQVVSFGQRSWQLRRLLRSSRKPPVVLHRVKR